MTEVTYRTLSEAAFEEIAKLSALGVRSEDIVMVITQDVFWAASVYETRWCLNHNVQELTVSAKFYGHDVGVINEESETMFRAAIKGLYDSQDMDDGALVVIDSDSRNQADVYIMERSSGHTTQLRDTGLTVSFGYNQEAATTMSIDVAADAAAELLQEPLFMIKPDLSKYFEPLYTTGLNYQWVPSQFEHFQLYEEPKTRAIGSACIKPKKKVEAKPDTSALDEFLSSFKVLESAT